MPFGKFRGVEIADLPDEYVAWLHGLDDLREPLRSAIDAEREARHAPAVFRALALRHHPDHGGESAAMRAVLDAAAWLRRQIRRGA